MRTSFFRSAGCVALFCIAGLSVSCTDAEVIKPAESIPLKAGMQQKVTQDNDFSFDLLRQTIAHADDTHNVFISPLSMSMAFGMVLNGATGPTRDEIEQVLYLNGLSNEEINEYYQIMREGLLSVDPQTRLNIANSIWYRTGFAVKDSFLNVNRRYFKAEVSALDFNAPDALKRINGWCAKATNNLITNPLDKITPDAMLYLINAIYFKGKWVSPFNPKETKDAEFITAGGNGVTVKMMSQKNSFMYGKDELAQYLDMPYGNNAFSMTVILPVDGVTTGQVLEELTAEKFATTCSAMKQQTVNVSFPKFTMKQKYEMKEPMLALGMQHAFSDMADFSLISDIRLLISRIIHSTFVEVDEVGTEAAAVTIVEFEYTSAQPESPYFIANKPFIFLIREKSTGAILFAGVKGE